MQTAMREKGEMAVDDNNLRRQTLVVTAINDDDGVRYSGILLVGRYRQRRQQQPRGITGRGMQG